MDAHTRAQHPLDDTARGAGAQPSARLDISAAGDCLALVRHTFGALPRESLVVIGLLDGSTGGHMRIDLQPALREPFASARLIAECLAGEGSAPAPEAALVVFIGEDPPTSAQDEAWRASLDALHVMLESEYCVQIVQAWFVSADHVRDPRCAHLGCCALPGRRIDELRIPALGGLDGQGSRPEAQPLEQAALRFLENAPRAEPALAALVAESRRQDARQRDTRTLRRRLEAWDDELRRRTDSSGEVSGLGAAVPEGGSRRSEARSPAPEAAAERLTELLQQLRTGFDRDQLIPLATLGLDAALLGGCQDRGLITESLKSAESAASAEDHALQEYASSFLGETERRPDWGRVDALESALNDLLPYARDAERENLLCLMAWIEWARGRGTAAGSFIDRCLQEFPDNQFSRLIERLMQLKGVCLWARVKQHSWSWARNSGPRAG